MAIKSKRFFYDNERSMDDTITFYEVQLTGCLHLFSILEIGGARQQHFGNHVVNLRISCGSISFCLKNFYRSGF
jgi:hypothetical protein